MSESKEIKFKFVVDQQSAQQVNKVLDEMIKRAQELAKTLASVAGGGLLGGGAVGGRAPSAQSTIATRAGSGAGGAQKSSFAAVVSQNLDAFKKVGSEGAAAMKIMTEALQRGIVQQRSEISKLNADLDRLVSQYNKVGGSSSGAFGEMLQGKILSTTKAVRQATEDLKKMEDASSARETAMYGPELADAPAAKGRWGRFKDAMYSSPGGGGLIQGLAPTGIGGWMRVGGMALAGADAAFAEARSGTRAYNQAEASRGQMMNPRIRALKGGDVSDIMALQMMDSMSKSDLKKQVGGTGAEAEAVVSGLKSVVSRTLGAVTSGVLGQKGGNILGGLTTTGQEGMKAENMFKYVDNFKQSTQYLRRQMAMERFEGGLEGRVGSAKMMGYGIRRRRNPDGTLGPYRDTYSEREAELRASGYSLGEEQAAFGQVMGVAGRGAGFRHRREVMGANAAGYGGYGELVGISERLGMDSVLARTALGGGIEKSAGIELGRALLGTGFDVQGMTSRAGVMAAMQAGMGFQGNAKDFPLVQQGLAGLQMGGAISTGQTSPWQRGANLMAAMDAGASNTYLQDYLGNQMGFEKMIDVASGGDKDKTLEALGGSRDMVKKALGGKMSAALGTLYDKGLEGTEVGDAVKRFRESGMDITDYLQQVRAGKIGQAGDIETLGIAAAQATGMGQEAGIGWSKTISGIGADAKTGRVGAGRQDELVSARLKRDADTIQEAGQELAGNIKTIAGAFSASGDLARSYESFGQNLSGSAEILTESFMRLADAANKAAMKLDPQSSIGGSSKAPATGKAGARK